MTVKKRIIWFVKCEECGYVYYDREEKNAGIAEALHSKNCGRTELVKSHINLEDLEIEITEEM